MPNLTISIFIIAAAIWGRNDYFRQSRVASQTETRRSPKAFLSLIVRAVPAALRSAKFLIIGTVIGFVVVLALESHYSLWPIAVMLGVYVLSWIALSVRDYTMGMTPRG